MFDRKIKQCGPCAASFHVGSVSEIRTGSTIAAVVVPNKNSSLCTHSLLQLRMRFVLTVRNFRLLNQKCKFWTFLEAKWNHGCCIMFYHGTMLKNLRWGEGGKEGGRLKVEGCDGTSKGFQTSFRPPERTGWGQFFWNRFKQTEAFALRTYHGKGS